MMKEDQSEEKVMVRKSKLNALLERVQRLEYAADKSHLSHYDAKRMPEVGKTAQVSTYEGKVVVAWRMTTNIVERNALTGVWMEKQDIELIFLDNTKEEVPYVQFIRRYQKRKVKILSETAHDDGRKAMKVETIEEGLETPLVFEIDVTFIN